MNFIRHLLIVALSFIFVLECTACSEEKNEPDTPVNAETTVSPGRLDFGGDNVEWQNITVKGTEAFNVSVNEDWVNIKPLSGGESLEKSFTVSCSPNPTDMPRNAKILVKSNANGKTLASVEISQAPGTISPTPDPEPEAEPLSVDQVYEALGLGWNLGNQLDAHANEISNETIWGNPRVTQETFDAVRKAGFKSIRIPVTWMGHIGSAPDYKIESAWLERVAELVDYAERAGLTAIINIHHDGANSEHWLDIKEAARVPSVNAKIEAQLEAMWSQIATRFADKGDFLIFESMNEIHDGSWGWGDNRKDGGKQYDVYNRWQQIFVNAVRAAGGKNENRWLGIPSYCTSIELGEYLNLPYDPARKLMVAVHCYDPIDYTLNDKFSEWGHTGVNGKKDSGEEKDLVAQFDRVVNRWISKGIPVYMGEFGCVHRANERAEAFRRYYLEYYTKAASDRKIPVIYWDNGYPGTGMEMSGLFNRTDGSFHNSDSEEVVKAMVRGFYSPNLTLDEVYNSAPK